MSYKKASDGMNKLISRLKKESNDDRRASGLLWADYVGEKIAQHSTIADINRGYLVVDVYHPSFNQLVRLRTAAILKKINVTYPNLEIKEIKIRVVDPPPDYKGGKKEDEFSSFFKKEYNEEDKFLKEKDSSFSELLDRMKKRAEGKDI